MAPSVQQTISTILSTGEDDSAVAGELLPLVYEELKRLAASQLARENPGQTLQPTALVHEAYIRLVQDPEMRWESRGHFFAAAARSMRQILINRAVRRKTEKHGSGRPREALLDVNGKEEPDPERLLALDDALKKLEEIDPRKSKIVMLRYFAGLSIGDTAQALDMSLATVKRDWQFARTWLHQQMGQ